MASPFRKVVVNPLALLVEVLHDPREPLDGLGVGVLGILHGIDTMTQGPSGSEVS